VAIIGGGFSGAAIAYHLARAGAHANVIIFEPRARLGGGLAYGGADPVHRINVPATRMSLLPDDETHFARWLEASGILDADPEALSGGGAFPRRREFGRYVDETLRPFIASGRVRHIHDAVVELGRIGEAWRLCTRGGREWDADWVAVATTHPEPAIPPELKSWQGDSALIAHPLTDNALAGVRKADSVLIVGTGLTSADLVASLDARRHSGGIVMISRRGLRARGHPPQAFPPEGDFVSNPARTATRLVADIRRAVKVAESSGRSWHPVFDALRTNGGDVWRALDAEARRRVVRHLRPFWDVHRFRVAPQIDAVLDRKLADGSLEILKARLGEVAREGGTFRIDLRNVRKGTTEARLFDRIIVATGPAHGDVLRAQPFLRCLAAEGIVSLDNTGLGIQTSRAARAVDSSGQAVASLFIAGPLARGTFGELMGLPQVSNYALFVAEEIAAALRREPGPCSRDAFHLAGSLGTAALTSHGGEIAEE
jgi:uncharacterized NAD(P)/FAD-binding protein YdhS